MKAAIVGSRGLYLTDFSPYLPEGVTEIVSGGARGIDNCAREYAKRCGIKLTEFLPEYDKYGSKAAPHMRNDRIIDYADIIIAFWDGRSPGTRSVIEKCKSLGKKVIVYKEKK